MRIYVASSWRNDRQQEIVELLRVVGHAVYDFKNPKPGDNGFHWSEVDPEWESWDSSRYLMGLVHPIAQDGYNSDFEAMQWADACVLVLPCGRSAHLEAGWFVGQGKPTAILLGGELVPDLMYKMVDFITSDPAQLAGWLTNLSIARAANV